MLNLDAIERRREAATSGAFPTGAVLIEKDIPAVIAEDRDLRKKLEQSDAAAAAMRAVLKHAEWAMIEDGERYCVMCGGEEDTHGDRCSLAAALSPTAGVELLERVKGLEIALKWALEILSRGPFCGHCFNSSKKHTRTCPLRKAQKALGK